MKRVIVWSLLAACAAGCAGTSSQQPPAGRSGDEAAVIETIERFFVAMAARDGEAYAALTIPDAMTISARVGPDGTGPDGAGPVRMRTHAEHVEALSTAEHPWHERMWSPVVMVHGPIALVWTPYDFRTGEVFSHCGIDAFELLKVDGTWRLANASWTVEPDGCNPGPPIQEGSLEAERAAVLQTLERMFTAMADRDVEGYAATLVPEGRYSRHLVDSGASRPLRMLTNAQDIEEFKAGTGRWHERIWQPIVHVHPPIAVVWAPYDFHVDGVFSHCGVNNFQFLRVDGAWKVTNASWTVEKEGCAPSPLGPLKPTP
jgi:hypothetical protein